MPRTTVRPIDPHLEAALSALASEGLPAQPAHLDLSNVVWGGCPCRHVDRVEMNEEGELLLEAESPGGRAIVEDPAQWSREVFRGLVAGYGALVIDEGASDIVRVSVGADGSKTTARLRGWAWHLAEPRGKRLWAALLRFTAPNLPIVLRRPIGNMLLRVGGRSVRSWRFETPKGLVFLVRSGQQWFIAFEADEQPTPELHHVRAVLAIIGFVLGAELRVGLFQSVADHGAIPALARLHLFGEHSRRPQLPALPFNARPAWLVRFVERALRFVSDHPDGPLLVAMHHYFRSLDIYVDSNFLHAWVGAEALAKWGLKRKVLKNGGELRIADHDGWFAWVKSHEDEIKAHALPGQEQRLWNRVLGSETDSQSPVQRVFRGAGMVWTDVMADAEAVRNGVAHEGKIPQRGPRDWDRDLERVGLAQTMLTALASMLIGYDGPIADRTRTSSTAADAPSWWNSAELDEELDYHSGD